MTVVSSTGLQGVDNTHDTTHIDECGDAAGMGKSSRPGFGHETHQGRQACHHCSHAQGR